MMEEPTLFSQTRALGDAMRSYRSFHLPGVDMLCDRREYTTVKQAQSAAHQFGCSGVLSELYGVTDWDYDFRGHKSPGDWQAALRVTVRVHHLSWVSMAGESKRDYPASIFYQSPWWQQYPLGGRPFYTSECRVDAWPTGVSLNGVSKSGIAFAPYVSALGFLPEGDHALDLTLFGKCFNAFGTVHAVEKKLWVGPESWRTKGPSWCVEYRLRPLGILTAPILQTVKV